MTTIDLGLVRQDEDACPHRQARRSRPSKDTWRAHRYIIRQKYIIDGLSLTEVRHFMIENHGFCAKERQYRTRLAKWGYLDIPTARVSGPTKPLPNTPCESSVVLINLIASRELPEALGSGPGCPSDEEDSLNVSTRIQRQDVERDKVNGQRQSTGPSGTTGAPNESEPCPKGPLASQSACDGVIGLSIEAITPNDSEKSYIPPKCSPKAEPKIVCKKQRDRKLLRSVSNGKILTALDIVRGVFQNKALSLNYSSMPEDELDALLSASNFLFAAQSYKASFAISRATREVIKQGCTSPWSIDPSASVPAWLATTINMARSTTCPEDLKDLMQALADVKPDDMSSDCNAKESGLLYAYLGCALHRSNDHPQAKTIAAASWDKLQSMPQCSYLMTRYIIEPAIADIMEGLSHIQPGPLTQKEFRRIFCVSSPNTKEYVRQGLADEDIRCIIQWAHESLSEQDFHQMIYKINHSFWTQAVAFDKQDIQQFELLVVYCYLCRRLWQMQRSDTVHESDTTMSQNVLYALERLHQHIGVSKEDIVTAFISLVTADDCDAINKTGRATMRARYQSAFEALQHSLTLHIIGYVQGTSTVSLDRLIQRYEWPGKTPIVFERFSSSQYRQRVQVFLEDFLVETFEVNLTERLRQSNGYWVKLSARKKVLSKGIKLSMREILQSCVPGDQLVNKAATESGQPYPIYPPPSQAAEVAHESPLPWIPRSSSASKAATLKMPNFSRRIATRCD